MLPKLFILSVMFLVLYRHLKSLFFNYHVFDSSLFHHLFLSFFVPYYWHVIIIINRKFRSNERLGWLAVYTNGFALVSF